MQDKARHLGHARWQAQTLLFYRHRSYWRGSPGFLQNQVPDRILLSRLEELHRADGLPGQRPLETRLRLQCIVCRIKCIQAHDEEEMYAIGRHEETEVKFKTLSEGERTIISVLYFIETCKGLINRGATRKKRIVVIDDPVSSLSTQYLFSLGRIISGTFYPEVKFDQETEQFKITPKIEQLFILTHSLYFMYEMTEMKKDQRHAYQKLFRISKSANGSQIAEMHYEHIQSDYHSYWMAVKDRTNPVLWANSMRNIIEYFFGFVEKKDLNAVFQKLTETRYQAFNRFINRESHSFGQNIYDFKEFDYDIFFEAFKKVFDESGYQAHFKKMMKIG